MATLAPSFAHSNPIASPIPLDPPVITTVYPYKFPFFINLNEDVVCTLVLLHVLEDIFLDKF